MARPQRDTPLVLHVASSSLPQVSNLLRMVASKLSYENNFFEIMQTFISHLQ